MISTEMYFEAQGNVVMFDSQEGFDSLRRNVDKPTTLVGNVSVYLNGKFIRPGRPVMVALGNHCGDIITHLPTLR